MFRERAGMSGRTKDESEISKLETNSDEQFDAELTENKPKNPQNVNTSQTFWAGINL